MFCRLLFKGSAALIVFAMPYSLRAAAFSDIPGEGNLRCLPPACPDTPGNRNFHASGSDHRVSLRCHAGICGFANNQPHCF